ncbi:MAG TPA: hypothetical protein VMY37_18575 [Thermoguttaceae bacterium]|nr:hypothetical protein [Thermoguttaceae bacterium]
MIRPIRPVSVLSPYLYNLQLARTGTPNGALRRQLGALARRRRLQAQQQQLRAGEIDYRVRPPYPSRPRAPG